jgi:hypothetical protein
VPEIDDHLRQWSGGESARPREARPERRVVFGEVVTDVRRDGQPLLYGMRRFGRWDADHAGARDVPSATIA